MQRCCSAGAGPTGWISVSCGKPSAAPTGGLTAPDTAVGCLAVLIAVPLMNTAVVGRHGDIGVVGTLFMSIPLGVVSLGSAGPLLMAAFFFLAGIAAVTSAVALLDVPVTVVMDRLGWGRAVTAWSTVVVVAFPGLPALLRPTC